MDDDSFIFPNNIEDVSFYSNIDFEHTHLPTDRLTIRYLQKHLPEKASHVMEEEGRNIDLMWDMDRIFVMIGYASVAGAHAQREMRVVINSYCEGDRDRLAQDAARELIRFGLADGPISANLILDGLEATGAAIAREQLGRTVP